MTPETTPRQTGVLAGFAWALLAVGIWAGWFTATAHGVRGNLAAIDVALVRVVVPTLVLAPLLWRARRRLAALRWWQVAGIALYGVPFVFLLANGLRFAPISHAVALVPGLMPMVAGVLGALFLGERLTLRRLGGFALMLLAAALIGAEAGIFAGTFSTEARGQLFFLAAGLCWALFTFTSRQAGLDPFLTTGLVALVSTVFLLPPYLVLDLGRLGDTAWVELLLQVLAQGLLAGLVAVYAYAAAIRTLGASPAAACAALVPAVATLIGWAVLAERPSPLEGVAMLVVGLGVYLASGVRLKAREMAESSAARKRRPAA